MKYTRAWNKSLWSLYSSASLIENTRLESISRIVELFFPTVYRMASRDICIFLSLIELHLGPYHLYFLKLDRITSRPPPFLPLACYRTRWSNKRFSDSLSKCIFDSALCALDCVTTVILLESWDWIMSAGLFVVCIKFYISINGLSCFNNQERFITDDVIILVACI